MKLVVPTIDDHPASLLTAITAGVAAGSDLQDLLQRFLEPIVQLAGAVAGAVRVLDPGRTRFELVGQIGLPAAVSCAERSVERHCGTCGAAADEARIVWADELSPCALYRHAAFQGAGHRAMLAVPLQFRGQLLGVYNLFFASGKAPDGQITAVLRSVGELLGLALHNAHLEAEHLRAAVLSERQHMAAEVHDSLAQTLYYMKMRMPLLHEAVLSHDEAHALQYMGDVRAAVTEAHASLRQILTHFRVPMDPRGLMPAIEDSVATFRQRTGVAVEMVRGEEPLGLSSDQEEQVFHIVQEALANIAKHAQARHVRVEVRRELAQVRVRVEDDGRGITPTVPTQGVNAGLHCGLDIMAERARRLGTALAVERGSGGGTCVRLSVAAGAMA
jgi:two-component system, NarL family, nitrate/nitrite sensor histidine kinase NarX